MKLLAALAWLPPAALGLVLAARLGRRGWPRALRGAWAAALVLAAVWLLVRLFDWLAGGQGPAAWAAVGQPLSTEAPVLSTVLRLGLGAGVVFAVALPIAARLVRPTDRPPLAGLAAGLAALSALLVVGGFASGPLAFSTALPLELPALMPLIAAGLAAAFLAPDPAPLAPVADSPAPAALAVPAVPHAAPVAAPADPEALLRQAQILGAAAPLFQVPPAAPSPETIEPLDSVWQAAGGRARAPEALRQALARTGSDGPGLLIGDLPAPTETALVTALASAAVLGWAARVLVIVDQPRQLRDRAAAALTKVGAWEVGPLVAGDGELRDALARGTLPALVALDPAGLSAALVAATPGALSWLTALDLVLLVRADQLGPIPATHLAFTLRRLSLALAERRVHPTWVALGRGGEGTLRFLADATHTHFEPLALGPSARAGVKVHVRSGAQTGELGPAERALAGLDVQLEDAVGELSDPTGRRAVQRPGYHGRVSLTLVDDRRLAGLFRARNALAHDLGPGADGHLGVWWVPDSPLARFLLVPRVLEGLERQDELPSPRPVAGLGNRYLAAAHLAAALNEGRPDEDGLRRAFGDAAVADLLDARKDVRVAGRRARWDAATHRIERAAIRSAGGTWIDPGRETITANAVAVKSGVTGAVLARADQRVAATRFHPHRVFRAAGALHQVGGAPTGAELLVAPAPSDARPTDPELQLQVTRATWVGTLEQHTIGKLTFARGLAHAEIAEQVTGAIPRGQAGPAARFAPVTSQYPTLCVVVMFSGIPSREALRHAGRLAADLLPAHLLVERDDVEVLDLPEGTGGVARPALVFVDRHVGGIGVAEALDARTIHNLLRWTWGVLNRCSCLQGCEGCTPARVLAEGPDKVGALKLLGG